MRRAPLVDRLLLWLFGAARRIFLLQGLASGCALVAAVAWVPVANAAPWITRALWSGGLLSGAFVVAGLLLWRMRSWPPANAEPNLAIAWPWRTALATSFVLMAVVTLIASAPLPSLWRQILAQLTAIEFWDGLENPGQFGGIVILPILLALVVPALVTITASFSFVFPLILLTRLQQRPSMFPVLVAMGAVCDAALVGSGFLTTRLLTDLAQAANTAMLKAPDAEVVQLAKQLTDAVATLTRTSTVLIVPAVALAVWAVFLRPSGRAAAAFGEPIEDAPELPNLVGSYKEEPFVAFSAEATEPPASPSRMSAGNYTRWALAGLGVLMLLFWMTDGVRSRAAYVASTPQPAASLAVAPPAIRVAFDHALDPASTLSLVYLPVVASENDIARDVRVTSRLASDDEKRQTIEAIPPRLGNGLYLVRWTAYPSRGGGVIRHGSFAFGVVAKVPPDSAGRILSLTERDSGGRGRRSTLLGGLVLLVLAALAFYHPGLDTR
jgi:hypothetical protein